MKFSASFSTLCLLLAGASLSQAATLAGSGTLSVANSSAGAPGTFLVNVSSAISEGSISYDIIASDPNGDNITTEVRGFGESGGGGNQFRSPGDTILFSIANLTITPAAGYSIDSQEVHFNTFTLSANGGNAPTVTWTTPEDLVGGTTATGANPSTTVESGVDGGSSITVTAATNWSWINDATTSYSVEFTTVPEPSSALLGLSSLLIFLRRRR